MQLTFAAYFLEVGQTVIGKSNGVRYKDGDKNHRKKKDKQRSISWYKTSIPATLLPKSSGLWPLAVLIYLVYILSKHYIIGEGWSPFFEHITYGEKI